MTSHRILMTHTWYEHHGDGIPIKLERSIEVPADLFYDTDPAIALEALRSALAVPEPSPRAENDELLLHGNEILATGERIPPGRVTRTTAGYFTDDDTRAAGGEHPIYGEGGPHAKTPDGRYIR